MNKLRLMGISTNPKYSDDGRWTGAELTAFIEIELQTGKKATPTVRCYMRFMISRDILMAIKVKGITDTRQSFFDYRIKEMLEKVRAENNGSQHDAYNIGEVIRLKLPRFITKSIERCEYSQNFRTGEIIETPEECLDREVKD